MFGHTSDRWDNMLYCANSTFFIKIHVKWLSILTAINKIVQNIFIIYRNNIILTFLILLQCSFNCNAIIILFQCNTYKKRDILHTFNIIWTKSELTQVFHDECQFTKLKTRTKARVRNQDLTVIFLLLSWKHSYNSLFQRDSKTISAPKVYKTNKSEKYKILISLFGIIFLKIQQITYYYGTQKLLSQLALDSHCGWRLMK